MNNVDAGGHVTGSSIYLDDIPERRGTLYAVVFGSEIAHGELVSFNIRKAVALEGVVKVITVHDIPGENEIGGIIHENIAEDAIGGPSTR